MLKVWQSLLLNMYQYLSDVLISKGVLQARGLFKLMLWEEAVHLETPLMRTFSYTESRSIRGTGLI